VRTAVDIAATLKGPPARGTRCHRSPTACERDVALTIAGWQVMRFTYAQVTRRSGWVAAALRAACRVDVAYRRQVAIG
jgi:very-short-patch-repair endonuclease